jgi:hypothetical protein
VQAGHEDLRDEGVEGGAIQRAFHGHRGGDACQPHGGHEGRVRAVVAWGGADHQAIRRFGSCSVPRRTFFDRDAEATDGARHGHHAHRHAVLMRSVRAVLG